MSASVRGEVLGFRVQSIQLCVNVMPRRKDVSIDLRGAIVAAHQPMKGYEAIFKQTEVPFSTVPLLPLAAPSFTTGRHSGLLCMFGLAVFFILHTLPDATTKGFASPPGIELGIFCLLVKCGIHYTVLKVKKGYLQVRNVKDSCQSSQE